MISIVVRFGAPAALAGTAALLAAIGYWYDSYPLFGAALVTSSYVLTRALETVRPGRGERLGSEQRGIKRLAAEEATRKAYLEIWKQVRPHPAYARLMVAMPSSAGRPPRVDDQQQFLELLNQHMCLVPAGDVPLRQPCFERDFRKLVQTNHEPKTVFVDGFYLDRYAVTNAHFAQFVADGGYEQPQWWHADGWAARSQFVDQAGLPSPRFWQNGKYPPGKDHHPVVGVSYFEASAFAAWAGKRLPDDSEWVKAACWPVLLSAGSAKLRSFPWGDAFDVDRANLWHSGQETTVEVYRYPAGKNAGGAFQLSGNVWEWTTGRYGQWHENCQIDDDNGYLVSLRGGSFRTYLDQHASNQFQSGDYPLSRRDNLGFRCALSAEVIEQPVRTRQPPIARPASPPESSHASTSVNQAPWPATPERSAG